MKLACRVAAVAIALAVASPAAGQARTSEARIGLGVGLAQADAPLLGGTLIFVPLNLAPSFRLEPFIGFDRIKFDAGGERASNFSIGTGVFFVNPLAAQVQMYAGGRIALNFASTRDAQPNPDKTERTDFFLGAVLGGEFLPHPRIAVGAEGMLGFLSIGDTEFTDGNTGAQTEAPGGSEIATQGTLFVRVYLF